MKKVAVLIFIMILACSLFAQQNLDDRKAKKAFDKEQKSVNWNFILQDGKLYWQKTFTIDKDEKDKAFHFFNQSTIFKKVGDKYTGTLALANYSGGGNIPHILQAPATITFIIQFKDDRYRVTILDIVWQASVSYLNVTQGATLTMQDLLDSQPPISLKQYGCKHTNICLLNLFDYKSINNNPNDTILNSDF